MISADEGGIVRSTILKTGDAYQMWYSYRGYRDYHMYNGSGFGATGFGYAVLVEAD